MMRVLLSSFVIGAASLCFPDGIPESERKELVNGDERYPVGLWIHDYAAQYATAELVAILVQEKVGYKLEKLGLGQLTPDAFFALAGCTRPTDSIDRGCSPDMITRAHISVEGWTGGYSRTWDQVQQDYPQTAPRNLGSMGYNGAVTLYIAGSVQDRGYQAEGISLDFYRDYNLSWRNPAKYFTKPQEINTSKLLACSQTTLMYVPEMKNYLEMTGDEEGVTHQGNGDVIGRCFDGHFWYAPACRANSSGCIPVITGGTGWSLNEMMQKGTLLSIPLATAVGKTWSEYTSLPAEYSVIFYWWVPDPSFLRLDAIPIRFPPFSRREWEKEMKRSEAELMSIDKYISQDLAVLAPDIERFMSAYALDIKDVEEIMSKKLDSGKPYFDVACDWLHANAERWQKWLPDKTKCFARYGLYNVKEEKFVDSRANPDNLKCEVCSPGSYSEPMKDLNGSTYVCQSCPQGSYQVSEAATQCDLCLKGEYQDDTGSSSCKRCGFGRYQDTLGQSSCKACPNETTTVGFGSLAISECGCLATTIAAGSNSSEGLFQCQPCPVGLECPLSSSIETLQRQEAALGAEYVPRVLEGYFADPTDPLVIYKCQPSTYCPGGKPGECAGGLSGKPCSTCSHGQTWTGEKCDDCRDEAIFIWAGILLLGTLLLFRAYNFVDSRALAEVSPVQACMIATSMTINVIQMIAVFGLMSVTWTPLLASTSSSLSFVLLDLDQLGASCVTGSGNLVRFLASGALFPAAALAILGRWALSRCLVRWALRCRYFEVTEWKLYKTVNFAGTLTQVGFATLSAWSLKPLMCYRHPNGSYSLLNYPGAFCGEAEQITMAIFGTALMAIFVVGFLCLCMFASWKLPTWSADGRFELVQSFTFLTSKFRLNTWWFGIALLLRGMCLSITVVLGTNQPEVQVALARVTLLIYLCSMVLVWPWKARALNLADTVLNSCLLLLVSQTVNVSETFSAVILIFILLSVASLGILCLLNLAISGKNLFNLGLNHDAAKISLTLKDCAEELLEIEACRLDEKLRKLNHYDIEVIKETITLISTEILVDAHHSFSTRMHFKAATRHGTTQFDAHVEASHEDLEPENEEVTLEMRIGLVDLGPTVAETL